MSPSGRHYGWYGDTTGYSGSHTNPQQFHVPRPESGTWRVSVEGMSGGPGGIEFAVQATPTPGDSHVVAAARGRRAVTAQ